MNYWPYGLPYLRASVVIRKQTRYNEKTKLIKRENKLDNELVITRKRTL